MSDDFAESSAEVRDKLASILRTSSATTDLLGGIATTDLLGGIADRLATTDVVGDVLDGLDRWSATGGVDQVSEGLVVSGESAAEGLLYLARLIGWGTLLFVVAVMAWTQYGWYGLVGVLLAMYQVMPKEPWRSG